MKHCLSAKAELSSVKIPDMYYSQFFHRVNIKRIAFFSGMRIAHVHWKVVSEYTTIGTEGLKNYHEGYHEEKVNY